MQTYYLVNGYRFITLQKELKIHEMNAAKMYFQQNN